MVETFAQQVIRWRWLVIVATFILIGLIGKGGQHIGFTTNYRAFFSEDNPQLLAFEAVQDTYSKSDNVLFILNPLSEDGSGTAFDNTTLQLIEELTEAAWQLPYSTRVDSLSNYQHTVADGDDLLVADLYEDGASLTPEQIDYIKNVALNEPLLIRRLVSVTGHVAAVNVTTQLPQLSEAETPEVVAAARELASEFSARYPDIEIMLSGMVMMNNGFSEASQADMSSLIPLMFVVIILTLGILLRSISATLATLIVIVMSIVTGMGITGWLGWQLAPPSASAPTIIMTMAVADCVHLLVTYLHGLRHGQGKHEAMIEAIRINFGPIFLTSLSTAIGFLTMNFSEVPPFRDLGNIVAMGVGAAFVLSVTFLPALSVVLPIRVKLREEGHISAVDKLADWVIARRRILLWGTVVFTATMVAMIPQNELNDQFTEYFHESVPFRQASDFANDNLSSVYTIEYSLTAASEGGINEPAFLNKVESFAQWLRTLDDVQHVNTITDTFKRLNKSMHGDDPSYYQLPAERELAAQYLLLYEMSLPYGLDLNDQIDLDKSATRVIATFENLSTVRMLALEQQTRQWLQNNAPEIEVLAASPNLMFSHIGDRNVKSMIGGTILALTLISALLIIALRSFKLGLISLAPNLVPAAIAFGLWAILFGQVGMSLATAIGMTLGIVVDDTVHFLSKYRRARREKNYSAEQAVRYAYSTVVVALTVTTLVLVAGFGILTLSKFSMNSDMGLMTALTIFIALIIDLLFLPALLIASSRAC